MTQTFTSNDLVRHLYTEESPQEYQVVDALICGSQTLATRFDHYRAVKKALNTILIDPHPDSVSSILCYSQLTQPAGQKQ